MFRRPIIPSHSPYKASMGNSDWKARSPDGALEPSFFFAQWGNFGQPQMSHDTDPRYKALLSHMGHHLYSGTTEQCQQPWNVRRPVKWCVLDIVLESNIGAMIWSHNNLHIETANSLRKSTNVRVGKVHCPHRPWANVPIWLLEMTLDQIV